MVIVRQMVIWMMALSILSTSKTSFVNNFSMTENTPHIIFTGDSRTVGMQYANTEDKDSVYVAKSEQGYGWFIENIYQIQQAVTSNSVIIVNFGVNDLVDSDKYIKRINQLSDEVSCKVYYMSVNPVNDMILESKGSTLTNGLIADFNQKMKDGLSSDVGYIDCYNYLMDTGYKTIDGLHYSNETYQKIHDYCIQKVKKTKLTYEEK